MGIKIELEQYIEQKIIPIYKGFDKAHNESHVRDVIKNSFSYLDYFDVEKDMVYVAAAYHDIGLMIDRPNHHIHSGNYIRKDSFLKEFFSPQQIETMAQAAEDHRASSKTKPRSDYGIILAEADRNLEYDSIILRTVQYNMQLHPEASKQEHINDAIHHLSDKYGDSGYLKLWCDFGNNMDNLQILRDSLNSGKVKKDVEQIYNYEIIKINKKKENF